MRNPANWLVFALSGLAFACGHSGAASGGRAFMPEWQNDAGKSIQAVYAKVGSQAPPVGASVAVGLTGDGMVGIGLDKSGAWSYLGPVDTEPTITGDLVIATGGRKLYALDAKSGRKVWEVPIEKHILLGAGDDGTTTVASLGSASGNDNMLVAVSRDGDVKREIEANHPIGVPAVQGGVVFVPWQNQYVSAIDLDSGDEIGRLLLREQVSHAQNIGGKLYFGEASLTRFDDKIGGAAQGQATSVKLPPRELPGKPVWFTEGTQPLPAKATARERIRLYARPDEAGTSTAGGRYAATYFRVAMGLDSSDASLEWAKTFERDVLGGSAAQNGFVFCDAAGNVTLLDSNGGAAGSVSLGKLLVGCVVQAGGFSVPAGKPRGSLAEQIAEAIQVRETQMATAQRFLLRELGAMEDAIVTKALIDLASNVRTPPQLLEDSRKLLAARRNGADYMLAALEQHYDFLSDILRSPPVGPMAEALAAMNEARAAKPLARHLNDAANTPDDIERAARALSKLATKEELGELETFFALYRATASDKELVNAVIAVAEALIRIGGDAGKKLVSDAKADPMTQPEVKNGLDNLATPKADKADTKPVEDDPGKSPAGGKPKSAKTN
jgi:outer membrane protein assembly factor BamB